MNMIFEALFSFMRYFFAELVWAGIRGLFEIMATGIGEVLTMFNRDRKSNKDN